MSHLKLTDFADRAFLAMAWEIVSVRPLTYAGRYQCPVGLTLGMHLDASGCKFIKAIGREILTLSFLYS